MNDFANYIIENGMEKFIKELNKLNGKGYVDSFLTVYEYVKSKLARVEHAGNTGITIINIKGDAIPSQLASLEGDNQRQLRSVDGE